MKVVEEFSSLQGEGKFIGVPSYFIRTTGCNLRCSWKNPNGGITICDTPYTSFYPEKGYKLDLKRTLNKIHKSNIEHIVITGGEPTLQKDLKNVVDRIVSSLYKFGDYKVTVETNGTKFIKDIDAFMSLSPKLTSSGYLLQGKEKRMHEKNNQFLESCSAYMSQNDYQFKFVGNNEQDLREIKNIEAGLGIPSNKIYIMPQGISTEQFEERQKMLTDFCMENNFNYAPRLHIDLWGNKRGK